MDIPLREQRKTIRLDFALGNSLRQVAADTGIPLSAFLRCGVELIRLALETDRSRALQLVARNARKAGRREKTLEHLEA